MHSLWITIARSAGLRALGESRGVAAAIAHLCGKIKAARTGVGSTCRASTSSAYTEGGRAVHPTDARSACTYPPAVINPAVTG